MRSIFLSAAVPPPEAFHVPTDRIAAREAVLALVSQLGRHELCFGGHPAISPFVLTAAESLDVIKQITIFQARWFFDEFAESNLQFTNFQLDDGPGWSKEEKESLPTQEAASARTKSLAAMRRKMLAPTQNYVAAFFIGGKDGVIDEWEEMARSHPSALLFPIASTGGAAAVLWEHCRGECLERMAQYAPARSIRLDWASLYERMKSTRRYRALMHDLFSLF